jgi:hypothetical protein
MYDADGVPTTHVQSYSNRTVTKLYVVREGVSTQFSYVHRHIYYSQELDVQTHLTRIRYVR